MPGKKNVLFVIISILLCFASNVSAQDRTRIALSVRNVVLLPFYYAKDRQIFDKNGLYVEIVHAKRPADGRGGIR
jgi:ABC-type nitrate/sulfonate/bicarbonate transport system substrate-binding protein